MAMPERMTYKDAMALRDKGQLTRRVMTEKGWVVPSEFYEVKHWDFYTGKTLQTLHLPKKK